MSTIPTDIEIRSSTSKGIKIILALSIFVVGGTALIVQPNLFTLPFEFTLDTWIVRVVGIATVLFFGAGLVFVGLLLYRNRASRLHIGNQGITDQTSLSSVGFIDWRDLTSVERIKLSGAQAAILLKVANPEEYIGKAQNKLAKTVLERNMKAYGTPLVVNASFLRISSTQLYALLKAELNKHRHFITE